MFLGYSTLKVHLALKSHACFIKTDYRLQQYMSQTTVFEPSTRCLFFYETGQAYCTKNQVGLSIVWFSLEFLPPTIKKFYRPWVVCAQEPITTSRRNIKACFEAILSVSF